MMKGKVGLSVGRGKGSHPLADLMATSRPHTRFSLREEVGRISLGGPMTTISPEQRIAVAEAGDAPLNSPIRKPGRRTS